MTKRTVFHITYDRARKCWVAKVGGQIVDAYYEKDVAVSIFRARCFHLWVTIGVPCQLVIHTKTGKIAKEHTYGNDPKRSKG